MTVTLFFTSLPSPRRTLALQRRRHAPWSPGWARGGVAPGTGLLLAGGRDGRCAWQDVDLAARLHGAGELDQPVDQREQSVVLAAPDVAPGMKAGAALPHDDAARAHELPAEALDAQALRVRLAVVLRRRLTFFVSHARPLSCDAGHA